MKKAQANTSDRLRLDRYVSMATGESRSQVQRYIRAGAVQVNEQVINASNYSVHRSDRVALSGAVLRYPGPQYWMVHKPEGYLCATHDGHHPTVLDLVANAPAFEPSRSPLQIVGRLDLDTTGLVLLTDDGQWNHRVTAPRRHCLKRYRVRLAEAISEQAMQQLREGIILRGESRPTQPARVSGIGATEILLEISEGRYHQVKRMLAAVGNRVVDLHRDRIGAIELDPALSPGQCRPLTDTEIASV